MIFLTDNKRLLKNAQEHNRNHGIEQEIKKEIGFTEAIPT